MMINKDSTYDCYFRSLRWYIKQILDSLTKAEFKYNPERSPGSDSRGKSGKQKAKKKKKPNASGPSRYTSTESEQSQKRPTVDEELQQMKEVAKEYMTINNRNWGKMSAMMLAAETRDREIIAHDLCWKVIRKIWRNGKIRQQVCTTDFW